jgi:hypothetical protein
VAVNTDGKREIVGLHIGLSEAETFWSGFLKSLARRGLRGVKLVISDAHEGLKAAIRRARHHQMAMESSRATPADIDRNDRPTSSECAPLLRIAHPWTTARA